jgi:hypothetical protein
VRHVPDGVLRRLDDEPLAVPDRVTDHVAGCERCRGRRARIARDTEHAANLFSAPRVLPDDDLAWVRLRRELYRSPERRPQRTFKVGPLGRRRAAFPRLSLRAGLAVGSVAVLIAGTAAAATFTTIFAPTHVAALSLDQRDLQAITAFMGGNSGALGGFSTPSGSSTLRFGTINWSSRPGQPVSSLQQAEAQAGFSVPLPAHLPAGVGALRQIAVQPRLSATVTFNSAATSLAGSSVTLDTGPAVFAGYGGSIGTGVPTLGVAIMPRPRALSSGASLSQIEAFMLSQPGIPPELAEEVRLLGDLRTTLPVPVPSGASVRQVKVDGSPAVLLADASNAAAGVIWEDGQGFLHAVVGILDSQDVLNVATQLG